MTKMTKTHKQTQTDTKHDQHFQFQLQSEEINRKLAERKKETENECRGVKQTQRHAERLKHLQSDDRDTETQRHRDKDRTQAWRQTKCPQIHDEAQHDSVSAVDSASSSVTRQVNIT